MCSCNWYSYECASIFSANITANFLHLHLIGNTEVLRVLCRYHLHFSPHWLLVLEQLQEQLWYWLTIILERVCCQCQTKLVKKILKFEFIEMYDLLPETWLRDEEGRKGLVGLHCRKSAPITNILQWVQCFVAMVYQATIMRCYRDFKDLHWIQYNRMYWCQVAITKDTMLG